MKEYFQKVGQGIEDQYKKINELYQKLSNDAIRGLKSFSENPAKHTKEAVKEFGKDYWDLLASILTGYAGIKIATRTGASSPIYTDPAWLATLAAWYGTMFSPFVLKPEKTTYGNHTRAVRNLFGGIIPPLHAINPPPLDWIMDSLSGSVGLAYEYDRRRERKRAYKISEPEQKPENLEKTINQSS